MAHSIAAESEPWVTFLWNIENYDYCWQKSGEYIESPSFNIKSTENTLWRLLLYPRGKTYENFISIALEGDWVNQWMIIKIKCDTAILAEDGSVLKITDRKGCYFPKRKDLCFDAFVGREELTKTQKQAFLTGDTLRIRCRLWRSHVKAAVPAAIFARTVLSVEKRNFLWDIVRFSSFESDEKLYYFIEQELNNWRTSMFITDTNGSRMDLGKCETWPPEINKEEQCLLSFTKNHLIEKKNLNLKNDVLSLYCEFSWTDGLVNHIFEENDSVITSSSISDSVIPKPSISSPCTGNEIIPKPYVSNADGEENDKTIDLIKDIENLYVEGILCDVKLRTATRTFPAHKVFLCARSPVFRQMFTTDMKEKIRGCVDVPDLEDDTVHRMLQYIYTDALEDLQWESILRLYAAADKYEIVTLKTKCSSFLKRSLCPSNLCDILVLAERHVDGDLKKAAQNCALEHEEDVFRSEEWAEFMKANSSLAMETMILKWKKS
ncbi:hypothetical protein NPIL_4231 [Nephila pilipes]|uniref:Uncharacterized protein n=1 Tax=Nephila pilipes TaxID=299642 RepID=A0A8X6KLE7_NEPPI|nr:hypothetical protein NPIL_4231 [Nephila pilipes]